MKLIPQFLHRRSLSVALVTMALSFGFCLATAPGSFASVGFIRAFVAWGMVLFLLFLCALAWINLIRDVERGYEPWRCQLAAVLLLAATIWPVVAFAFVLKWLLFDLH